MAEEFEAGKCQLQGEQTGVTRGSINDSNTGLDRFKEEGFC